MQENNTRKRSAASAVGRSADRAGRTASAAARQGTAAGRKNPAGGRRRPAAQANPRRNTKRRPLCRRRRSRAPKIIGVIILALALIALTIALIVHFVPKEIPRSYPMEYAELIRSNAAMQGIEPAQAAAVILAESGYDPMAISNVNAQGLMQIMPDTGKWLAGKFDEEYVEGCLFDPATNIRYGCWYLGYLMRRYDGDMICATAAYHSGQGTVDKWLADPAFSSDGKTLAVINGKNAQVYVRRVLEYYEKYSELYGPA